MTPAGHFLFAYANPITKGMAMLEALIIGFVGSLLASAAWHYIARWLHRDDD